MFSILFQFLLKFSFFEVFFNISVLSQLICVQVILCNTCLFISINHFADIVKLPTGLKKKWGKKIQFCADII